jgi:uncharacterized damage-inducible protein DinB
MATPLSPSPSPALFGDMDHELHATRRVLERVPMEQADWKPHAKSMSLAQLAIHVATLPSLTAAIMGTDDLDAMVTPYQEPTLATREELLAQFDATAAGLRDAVNAADHATFGRNTKLRAGDFVIVDRPKGELLRHGLSHVIHHRAQLIVYLRLLDVPVPGLYGPSADEPM